jgi:phenylacetate-CoA ligase
MRRLVAKHFGLYLNDALKGDQVHKYYAEFEKQLKFDRLEIQNIQLSKAKALIEHAYDHTSFYKTRLDQIGAKPGDFQSLNDIAKIPPLTRTDLQENWNSLLAKTNSHKHLHKGSSSGSTGKPVTYFHDNSASSAGDAALYICWSLAGWELGMKGLHIWGNPTTVKNEWSRKSSKMKAWVFNHAKFPAYQLTDPARIQDLANLIISGNYDFIDGYTNSIFVLADFMKANNLQLKKPLKMVLTTAENLHDYQRELIRNVLGPVYDLYGCGEIQGVANECRFCGKYHIIDTHVYLEFGKVVDEFSNRELIITDLDNFAFPMIRYQNGDAGKKSFSDNLCRIPFSTMDNVSGRQSDVITLPGGGTLSVPSFFGSMLLKKVNGIVKYQIEKDRDDHLTVKFVTSDEFKEQDVEIIKQALDDYLNDRIKYDLIFVDDIPVSETGKFKLVVDNTRQ